MDNNLNSMVEKMILENTDFPSFFACYDFGRGLYSDKKDCSIVASRKLIFWKVIEDRLQTKEDNILFDGENYVIQWQFDYVVQMGGEVNTEHFYFHWKGMNALKGFSPLPDNITSENAMVDRIYQWGEPPVFFHLFPQKLIVLNGKEESFNPNVPHLLMVRGELMSEIHLFELPCHWKNFRSQTVFFVIIPNKKIIYLWIGLSSAPELLSSVRRCKKLYSNIKSIHELWKDFQFVEVNEGEQEALNEVLGNVVDFMSIKKFRTPFTPKLFYLMFNGDQITAVDVKNPLRQPEVVSPFPFLQTHLYTAPQPAIFLLDNYTDLWLWKGLVKPETCVEKMNEQITQAKKLLSAYLSKIKENRGVDITVRYATASQEPLEFTNIFPYWKS